MLRRPPYILPLIVISQFAGTSLWFAGNAILPEIQKELHLQENALSNITSVVQLGFLSGTLVFAILSVADRFQPSRVFFVSSMLAALANLFIAWFAKDAFLLLSLRFITGFFLAGIYPVGMKIAADWYEKGLGEALGYLVGALVLGTAFPHLLKGGSYELPWKQVLYVTSGVAYVGGLLILLFVPVGPFRKRAAAFHPRAVFDIFSSKEFRAAAGGYFGHMWELYTLWAFVPALLMMHQQLSGAHYDISLWSFSIIAMGSLSCVAGGMLSQKIGSAKVACYSLLVSGICCLVYPLLMQAGAALFLFFMVIWGIAVIADSPQYSALVAQTAPHQNRGTALTFVTCIGFAITIASIQLLGILFRQYNSHLVFLLLAPGPIFGLRVLYRLIKPGQKKIET